MYVEVQRKSIAYVVHHIKTKRVQGVGLFTILLLVTFIHCAVIVFGYVDRRGHRAIIKDNAGDVRAVLDPVSDFAAMFGDFVLGKYIVQRGCNVVGGRVLHGDLGVSPIPLSIGKGVT